MRIESPLEQTLCLKYCAYYKPGKNEDLACRGYTVVERILREGKTLLFDGHWCKSEPATVELIVQTMCAGCDFHERDCDFMQNRTARPCGGFVLLEQLLAAGSITVEDIR
jgi:formate-dependent nitrite reductase cytochrome c552 subunit